MFHKHRYVSGLKKKKQKNNNNKQTLSVIYVLLHFCYAVDGEDRNKNVTKKERSGARDER